MKVNPKSEEEVTRVWTLPAGTYDFEVLDAQEKISKSGNEMIELQLRVFSPGDNPPVQVTDWLMEKIARKLRNFCIEVGLEQAYQQGVLDADAMVRRSGKLQLKVERSEEYGDRNRVKDYGEPKAKAKPHESAVGGQRSQQAVQQNMHGDEPPF